MFRLSSIGISDVGLKRKNNEDALLVRAELGLSVLADGMGGAAAGEMASGIFIRNALDTFQNREIHTEGQAVELMSKVFAEANEEIINLANGDPERHGMGCTAEVVVFYGERFTIGHVGDSRVYLFRHGQLRQLTSDHSVVQDQLDRGLITPTDARKHPLRHVILRAVGTSESLTVDFVKGQTTDRDLILVCSDGLTDMIDDVAIGEILAQSVGITEKAEKLIVAAKSAGGLDNITVILNEINE